MRPNIPLAQIPIAEPCSKDWAQMSGNEQKKFCQGCQKHVHNLSAMTRTAAEKLLCDSSGHLCVRYEFNVDGSVKTLDYAPAGSSRFGWKFFTFIGGTMAMLFAGARSATAQVAPGALVGKPAPTNVMMGGAPVPRAIMGDVAVSPPTTQPTPTTQPAPPMMGMPCPPVANPPTTRPAE